MNNKLTDLCGNGPLHNNFIETLCGIRLCAAQIRCITGRCWSSRLSTLLLRIYRISRHMWGGLDFCKTNFKTLWVRQDCGPKDAKTALTVGRADSVYHGKMLVFSPFNTGANRIQVSPTSAHLSRAKWPLSRCRSRLLSRSPSLALSLARALSLSLLKWGRHATTTCRRIKVRQVRDYLSQHVYEVVLQKHKSVNLSFTMTDIKNQLTDLCRD